MSHTTERKLTRRPTETPKFQRWLTGTVRRTDRRHRWHRAFDPADVATWSIPRILAWLTSCELHVQAHRMRTRITHGPACVCNTCVSRRSTYGK
jgi:hypothetical protein